MSLEPEEINTEHLAIRLTRKPGCIFSLEVQVNPAATQAAHSKALKKINKEISIPGFRKGKAPDALVAQQYGKYVKQEWNEILINSSFQEYLNKTQLFPLTSSQKSFKKAEVKSADLKDGATLVFEYEGRPEVPAIDPTKFKLKSIKRQPVTSQEVDNALHNLQVHYAEWNNVEGRPVQEGDFVDLTIEAVENPPRTICKDMRFEVVPGKMANWLRHLVTGKNVQESVEGVSEKEESEIEDFQPTHCRITINHIKTASLPALDESLAKKVGLSSIEELRPRIEEDLNRREDEEHRDKMRAQIEHLLISEYAFDIPASLIERQKKEELDRQVKKMSANEDPPEKMVEAVKRLEEEIKHELSKAYRLYYIAQELADKHQIFIQENELRNEMMRQIMLPQGERIIETSMTPEEAHNKVYVNLLTQKVLDFLVSKATVEE